MSSSSIVYVHGISEHPVGYSDEWYAALKPHLSFTAEKHEVRWSDIVNATSTAYSSAPLDEASTSVEEELRRELNRELSERRLRNRQSETPNAPRSSESSTYSESGNIVGSFILDDFVRYMAWEDTRNDILARFDDVVIPLLRAGKTLNIISHSWGTVVSYEGLRRLDQENLPGRVANLFVLGSALSIGTVQGNLFGRVTDGRNPNCVDNFVNIDAGGDVVGGSITPPFDDVTEYLQRVPTGCSMFRFRRWLGQPTARNPACAHSSYFQPKNKAVQRDILARHINQSLA